LGFGTANDSIAATENIYLPRLPEHTPELSDEGSTATIRPYKTLGFSKLCG
jgi:hypothetical protein